MRENKRMEGKFNKKRWKKGTEKKCNEEKIGEGEVR